MARVNRRSILSEQIAEILGSANSSGRNRTKLRAAAAKGLICGGVALLVVAPAQVEAIGLGDINVQSTLGRPLQAMVPLRVGSGESLPANCVKPGTNRGELTRPANLRVKSPAVTEPGTYNLLISTTKSLHEPMYELSLVINCPGTPVLVRHYVLMLDLPGTLTNVTAVEVTQPPTIANQPRQVFEAVVQDAEPTSGANNASNAQPYDAPAPARPDPLRSLEKSATPIQAGTLYRVRQGDTLSTVAARIDGRLPDTTWAVAERLFQTNPDAFIRNNPDLIKLGSLIQIPQTAELASLSPVSSTRLTQQTAAAAPVPEPAPTPSIQVPDAAPRVETVRSDASLTLNPQAELVLESNLVPVEVTSDNYQEITTANPASDPASIAEVEPVEAAATELEELTDTAASSPFADEDPADIPVNSVAKPQAAQSANVQAAAPLNDEISPWLAIGVGLLLGLAVSVLLLRERLLNAILNLFSRRDDANAFATKMAKASPAGKAHPERVNSDLEPDEFDTLAADAAFDTPAGENDDAAPLKIGDPLEKTYIVETADHEPTQEVSESPLETTDTSLQEKLEASLDPVDLSPTEKSDDEMLAEIFEEIPADASADAGGGTLEPTAQLPRSPEEEIFDPSGEFLQHLGSDIIDPTKDMPAGPTAEIDRTLMQAFNEDLEQIDPGLFEGSVQIDGAAETTEAEKITSHAAEETSLDALPKSSEEDDILSETLYDALTLLENDYEDEFTASQILERSAIKKSLATLDGETDDEDDTANRKLTG